MKTQIANSNANSHRSSKNNHGRALAVAAVLLSLSVGTVYAQSLSSEAIRQSGIGPTSCTLATGGNICPSPQYRSGAVGTSFNANLSGSPLGDGCPKQEGSEEEYNACKPPDRPPGVEDHRREEGTRRVRVQLGQDL